MLGCLFLVSSSLLPISTCVANVLIDLVLRDTAENMSNLPFNFQNFLAEVADRALGLTPHQITLFSGSLLPGGSEEVVTGYV